MVELPSGHLAIGTPEGLMLYDGQAWTSVPFDNQQAARSLALGRDGILYVGGVGDVAALVFDRNGPRLRSLLPELPEGERALPVVSEIAVAGERVFFRAGPRLLCRCGGALAVVGDGFHAIAAGGDELFALRREGLFRLAAGGGLEALRGMPAELGGEGLRQLAALDARRLVLGRADGRILRLVLAEDGLTVAELGPFAPGVTGRLQRLRWLAPDRLLVATYDRGAWLLDADGEILAHATPAQGLASPLVTDGTIDARGALWLTQDGGLSRVALHHPYREWLVSGGLGGRPVALLALPDGLLVGTVQGLVRLDREGWRRIEPVAMQTLALAEGTAAGRGGGDPRRQRGGHLPRRGRPRRADAAVAEWRATGVAPALAARPRKAVRRPDAGRRSARAPRRAVAGGHGPARAEGFRPRPRRARRWQPARDRGRERGLALRARPGGGGRLSAGAAARRGARRRRPQSRRAPPWRGGALAVAPGGRAAPRRVMGDSNPIGAGPA
ncbi:MAG: hypothetical protein RML12_09595 [Xanthomonadales bacterium]|nr:hypothetical protein [Xanthomonadales bacterium]